MNTSSTSATRDFARFKDLTGGGAAGLPETFGTMASLLEDASFDVVMEFQIRRGRDFEPYSVRVADGTATAGPGAAEDAHLTLITTEETWTEIAAGRLSPLDAFGDGQLRLRGDTGLGSRVLKHLAGTPGRVEIC